MSVRIGRNNVLENLPQYTSTFCPNYDLVNYKLSNFFLH